MNGLAASAGESLKRRASPSSPTSVPIRERNHSHVHDQVRRPAPSSVQKHQLTGIAECDKSFTRSDALAKHMRIQHNISPPLPGRGGNRKRKREEPDQSTSHAPDPYGYSTFKVESSLGGDDDEFRLSPVEGGGHISRLPQPPARPYTPDPSQFELDTEDELPQHLLRQADQGTGLIMGRSHTHVRYLLMKAKHRWVLEQHEALVEELRVLRHEEKCWRERKDALLDELLKKQFGCALLSAFCST